MTWPLLETFFNFSVFTILEYYYSLVKTIIVFYYRLVPGDFLLKKNNTPTLPHMVTWMKKNVWPRVTVLFPRDNKGVATRFFFAVGTLS